MRKCKFIGFRLHPGIQVTQNTILPGVLAANGRRRKFRKRTQHFQVIEYSPDYLAGRIITLNGNDARLLADIQTLSISVDPTPSGKAETTVNYFILHRKTHHGLYAGYGGSLPFADFGKRISGFASSGSKGDLKTATKEARNRADAEDERLTKVELEEIREKYTVKFLPLIRRDKLEQLVKSWQSLTAVRYEVATTKADADDYGAVGPETVSEIREFRLKPGIRPKSYVEQVEKFFSQIMDKFGLRLQGSAVKGKEAGGGNKTLNLNRVIDDFGTMPLSDVRADFNQATSELVNSQVLARMVVEANSRPAYFRKVKS